MASVLTNSIEKLNTSKERCSIKCSCPKKGKVVYYCKDKHCQNKEVNPLYCADCSFNRDKHDHEPFLIVNEIKKMDSSWRALKEDLNVITDEANKRYTDFEPLIHYFEHEMLKVSLIAQPPHIIG